jgi:hypothetical protein
VAKHAGLSEGTGAVEIEGDGEDLVAFASLRDIEGEGAVAGLG